MITHIQAKRSALAVLCACAVAACNSAREAPIDPKLGRESANVGLFTPGSTLGAITEAAAAGDDKAMMQAADMPSGDRCVGASGTAGTACMLTVTFTTTPIGEHWAPANVGAVWIEDASGTYIKTIERWAAVRSRSLYHWSEHACPTSWPQMDAVSQATLPDHTSQHSSMWDGKDFKGNLVPDGPYRVFIEVTETETNYGPLGMADFDKGATASSVQVPDAPPFSGLTLSYAPAAGGSGAPDAGHSASDAGAHADASVADANVVGDAGGTIEPTGMNGTLGGETTTGTDAGLLPAP